MYEELSFYSLYVHEHRAQLIAYTQFLNFYSPRFGQSQVKNEPERSGDTKERKSERENEGETVE